MGIELRILEPRADGVAPSRLGVAPRVELLSPDTACLAGVSSTSFLNWELFIVTATTEIKVSLDFLNS